MDILLLRETILSFAEKNDFLITIDNTDIQICEDNLKAIDRKKYIQVFSEYIFFGKIDVVYEDIDEEEIIWVVYNHDFFIFIADYTEISLIMERITEEFRKCLFIL